MPAQCLGGIPATFDDFDCPGEKARQLLKKALPDDVWSRFATTDVIEYTGCRGTYLILAHAQTKIYHPANGSCIAYACLQLTTSAPEYDRMLVEYLLLKNDENKYWQTANIFGPASDITVFFMIVLDSWLLAHIVQLCLQ